MDTRDPEVAPGRTGSGLRPSSPGRTAASRCRGASRGPSGAAPRTFGRSASPGDRGSGRPGTCPAPGAPSPQPRSSLPCVSPTAVFSWDRTRNSNSHPEWPHDFSRNTPNSPGTIKRLREPVYRDLYRGYSDLTGPVQHPRETPNQRRGWDSNPRARLFTGQSAFEAPPLRPLRYLSGPGWTSCAASRSVAAARYLRSRKNFCMSARPSSARTPETTVRWCGSPRPPSASFDSTPPNLGSGGP